MIDYGKVQSTVIPEAIKIDDYSVWITSDIKEVQKIEPENGSVSKIFQYNMKQYAKDEYILLMNSQLADTQNTTNYNAGGVDELGQIASDLTTSVDDLGSTLSDINERLTKLEGGTSK